MSLSKSLEAMMRAAFTAATAAAWLLVAGNGHAAQVVHPLEPADTSSPRATLQSFLDACNEAYALIRSEPRLRTRGHIQLQALGNRIRSCLDVEHLPEYLRNDSANEAAVCLKEVFDRIELPPWETIPAADAEQGANAEKLPERWRVPHTEITIARVSEGTRKGEYLFTAETVDRAEEFYQRVRRLPYRKREQYTITPGLYDLYLSEPGWMLAPIVSVLPAWARRRVYGLAVWQWAGLAIAVLVGLVLMALAYGVGRATASTMRRVGVVRYFASLVFPLMAIFVPLLIVAFVSKQVRVSGGVLVAVKLAGNLVFLFASLVLIVGVAHRLAEVIIASPRIHPRGLDAQLIRITLRLLGLVAATVVFLEGGQYLGIPLTTLLAGAGVGGLAVALAAQDALRNFFGSMMIILDRPFRVGERIVVKRYDGVVEEIGLRSTKIRLLTGHLATIPNEEMARSDVENVGRRRHIRRIADIALPLDTPPEQCETALRIVREALKDHEGMMPEFPPRVFLNELNRDSINIRVIYWYHPPNYWDFLAMSERLNLRIRREFAAAGIEFAPPTGKTLLSHDPDGQALRLAWDGDDTGLPDSAPTAESPHRHPSPDEGASSSSAAP